MNHGHHHHDGCHHHGPSEQAGNVHSFGHVHAPSNFNRAFATGVTLNLAFVVVEWICGFWANSLSLMADAGHNLSDVLGLLLAWAAHRLATARPSSRRTYGWKSSSILAALFNAQILLVAIGGIIWEAVGRLTDPDASSGGLIMAVAAVGVAINAFTAMLFMSGQKSDLNLRGAYLHLAADAAVSLGVVLAGGAILLTGQKWIDPVTSLIVALVILLGTWTLLRESLDLAMHAVPRHIDPEAVKRCLADLPGVVAVHDLHVWAMSTTEAALTAHLVKPEPGPHDELIARAADELEQRFGISHVTLQIETELAAQGCPLAPDHVV